MPFATALALLTAMPISHAVAQSYATTGNVNYTYGVGQLASVTQQGTARLAVDTGVVPVGGLRGSVKVRTLEAYGLGNVFVLDANHMPFYTVADQSRWKWPNGGEFDILETQNRGTFNQMSSHVAAPDNNTHCTMPATTAVNSDQTGLNCDAWSNYNAGCAYWDSRPTALGPGFNAGGGGVWAMTFDTAGSNMWFFPRAQVPADLAAGSQSVTPSNWGQPTAAFPFGRNCDVGLYGQQQLIITTTLCGQWAGLQQVFTQTCTAPRGGNCSSLVRETVAKSSRTQVYGDGSTTYAQAYWDINSLRVFSATAAGNATNTPVSTSSAAPSSTAAPSGVATSQGALPATTGVVAAAKSGNSVIARTIAPLVAIAAGALAVMTLA